MQQKAGYQQNEEFILDRIHTAIEYCDVEAILSILAENKIIIKTLMFLPLKNVNGDNIIQAILDKMDRNRFVSTFNWLYNCLLEIIKTYPQDLCLDYSDKEGNTTLYKAFWYSIKAHDDEEFTKSSLEFEKITKKLLGTIERAQLKYFLDAKNGKDKSIFYYINPQTQKTKKDGVDPKCVARFQQAIFPILVEDNSHEIETPVGPGILSSVRPPVETEDEMTIRAFVREHTDPKPENWILIDNTYEVGIGKKLGLPAFATRKYGDEAPPGLEFQINVYKDYLSVLNKKEGFAEIKGKDRQTVLSRSAAFIRSYKALQTAKLQLASSAASPAPIQIGSSSKAPYSSLAPTLKDRLGQAILLSSKFLLQTLNPSNTQKREVLNTSLLAIKKYTDKFEGNEQRLIALIIVLSEQEEMIRMALAGSCHPKDTADNPYLPEARLYCYKHMFPRALNEQMIGHYIATLSSSYHPAKQSPLIAHSIMAPASKPQGLLPLRTRLLQVIDTYLKQVMANKGLRENLLCVRGYVNDRLEGNETKIIALIVALGKESAALQVCTNSFCTAEEIGSSHAHLPNAENLCYSILENSGAAAKSRELKSLKNQNIDAYLGHVCGVSSNAAEDIPSKPLSICEQLSSHSCSIM